MIGILPSESYWIKPLVLIRIPRWIHFKKLTLFEVNKLSKYKFNSTQLIQVESVKFKSTLLIDEIMFSICCFHIHYILSVSGVLLRGWKIKKASLPRLVSAFLPSAFQTSVSQPLRDLFLQQAMQKNSPFWSLLRSVFPSSSKLKKLFLWLKWTSFVDFSFFE